MRLAGLWLMAALVLGEAQDGTAVLSPKETKEARKLYNLKCAKCHKFYDPADYTQLEWDEWMLKMSKKSKLKPAQHDLLSRYLETLRSNSSR